MNSTPKKHNVPRDKVYEKLSVTKAIYQEMAVDILKRMLDAKRANSEIQTIMADLQKQYIHIRDRIRRLYLSKEFLTQPYLVLDSGSDLELFATERLLKDDSDDIASEQKLERELFNLKAKYHSELREKLNSAHRTEYEECERPDLRNVLDKLEKIIQNKQLAYIDEREKIQQHHNSGHQRRNDFKSSSDFDLYLHKILLPQLVRQLDLYHHKQQGNTMEGDLTMLANQAEEIIWPLEEIPKMTSFSLHPKDIRRISELSRLYLQDVHNFRTKYSTRKDYRKIDLLLKSYFNNLCMALESAEDSNEISMVVMNDRLGILKGQFKAHLKNAWILSLTRKKNDLDAALEDFRPKIKDIQKKYVMCRNYLKKLMDPNALQSQTISKDSDMDFYFQNDVLKASKINLQWERTLDYLPELERLRKMYQLEIRRIYKKNHGSIDDDMLFYMLTGVEGSYIKAREELFKSINPDHEFNQDISEKEDFLHFLGYPGRKRASMQLDPTSVNPVLLEPEEEIGINLHDIELDLEELKVEFKKNLMNVWLDILEKNSLNLELAAQQVWPIIQKMEKYYVVCRNALERSVDPTFPGSNLIRRGSDLQLYFRYRIFPESKVDLDILKRRVRILRNQYQSLAREMYLKHYNQMNEVHLMGLMHGIQDNYLTERENLIREFNPNHVFNPVVRQEEDFVNMIFRVESQRNQSVAPRKCVSVRNRLVNNIRRKPLRMR